MASTGPIHLRRGLVSTGALLLLACVLVGQFVATTHEFAALHAVCPRHGELTEINAQTSLAANLSAELRHRISSLGEENGQLQHQHCLLVSSRRDQKNFRIVGPASSSLPTRAQWKPAAREAVVHVSRTLYLAAPKHSPPAA